MSPSVPVRPPAVVLGAALALCAAAAGCGLVFSKPAVKGSGKVATATLPPPAAFRALRVEGALQVELAESPATSLVVEADDNLHALLRATVENGTLHLRTEDSWESQNPFVVRVGGPVVEAIEASGAVRVDATGLRGAAARVVTSGASSVKVAAVDATELVPKRWDAATTRAGLAAALEVVGSVGAVSFEADELEPALRRLCEEHGWKAGDLFMAVRVAITGRQATPPLFDVMVALGRERTTRRLLAAAERVAVLPREE